MCPLKNTQSLNIIPKLICWIIASLDRKVLSAYYVQGTYHCEIIKNTALEKDISDIIISQM